MANFQVGSAVPITTAATGTHAFVANAVFHKMGVITSGGAAVTNLATAYFEGGATGGTNNYNIYATGGVNYFIGQMKMSGIPTGGGAFTVKVQSSDSLERQVSYTAVGGWHLRSVASGTGSATVFTIPHGFSGMSSTSTVVATANSAAAVGYTTVTIDATNITVTYSAAPASGTNNVVWSFWAFP
jgi:hypothetical protein